MSLSTRAYPDCFPVRSSQRHGVLRYVFAFGLSVALHSVIWSLRQEFKPSEIQKITPPLHIDVVMVSPPRLLEPPPTVQAPPPPVPPPVVKPAPPEIPPPKAKPVIPPKKPVLPRKTVVASVAPPLQQAAPVLAVAPVEVAPAPPAAPVVRAEPKPEPFTEARADAAYLNNPRPEYPAMARRRFLEGRVIMKVQVMASGHPGQVLIDTGSGHEILDEAALETVRQWRFVPAKRGDKAVDSWVKVPIVFKLNN